MSMGGSVGQIIQRLQTSLINNGGQWSHQKRIQNLTQHRDATMILGCYLSKNKMYRMVKNKQRKPILKGRDNGISILPRSQMRQLTAYRTTRSTPPRVNMVIHLDKQKVEEHLIGKPCVFQAYHRSPSVVKGPTIVLHCHVRMSHTYVKLGKTLQHLHGPTPTCHASMYSC